MQIVPCSRVGHFFRQLPYKFNADPDEIKFRNNLRTAAIWMDEYKAYFDVVIPRKSVLRQLKFQCGALMNCFTCFSTSKESESG